MKKPKRSTKVRRRNPVARALRLSDGLFKPRQVARKDRYRRRGKHKTRDWPAEV